MSYYYTSRQFHKEKQYTGINNFAKTTMYDPKQSGNELVLTISTTISTIKLNNNLIEYL